MRHQSSFRMNGAVDKMHKEPGTALLLDTPRWVSRDVQCMDVWMVESHSREDGETEIKRPVPKSLPGSASSQVEL